MPVTRDAVAARKPFSDEPLGGTASDRLARLPEVVAALRRDDPAAERDRVLQYEAVESIRKTVKTLGREVSFVRLTPEEKGALAEVVYAYKRQGIKTTENEINRIAINALLIDYRANGDASLLARVLAALRA